MFWRVVLGPAACRRLSSRTFSNLELTHASLLVVQTRPACWQHTAIFSESLSVEHGESEEGRPRWRGANWAGLSGVRIFFHTLRSKRRGIVRKCTQTFKDIKRRHRGEKKVNEKGVGDNCKSNRNRKEKWNMWLKKQRMRRGWLRRPVDSE